MYNYTMCGLDNVWLENGYTLHDTPYGNGVKIEAPDQLDEAIGLALVYKTMPLSGGEFRFLRQQLGLSQADTGSLMQVDSQTVARWEKSESAIQGAADKLLRMVFLSHAKGSTKIKDAIARINFMDRAINDKIVVTHNHKWHAKTSELEAA